MGRALCSECGDRPARGRGLCGTCRYRLDPEFREKHKAAMRRAKAEKGRSPGRMIDCPGCGRRRRHESHGLCAVCAKRERDRERMVPCAQCGEPTRPQQASKKTGLCLACYLSRGPTVGVCSTCGAEGQVTQRGSRKGLCHTCYHRDWGGHQPRQPARPIPPCVDCGTPVSSTDNQRCWPCELARRAASPGPVPAECGECGEVKIIVGRGYCRNCYANVRYRTEPAYRERMKAAVAKRMELPDVREKVNAQHRERWRADREFRERERLRKQTEAYRDQYREYARRVGKGRRMKRFGTIILAVTNKEIRALVARPCMACGTSERVTIEHLIPLARGGRHAIGNLAPLCLPCNCSKSNLTWSEWRFSDRPQAVKAFSPVVPGQFAAG